MIRQKPPAKAGGIFEKPIHNKVVFDVLRNSKRISGTPKIPKGFFSVPEDPLLKKGGFSVPKTNLDYIEIYANKLKKDNSLFEQQKMLIESQLHSSSKLFKKMFGSGTEFKIHAREYLRSMGLL